MTPSQNCQNNHQGISLKNVSKNFGKTKALNNISFDILPGDIVGFLGPNGAGKSTTMKIITGFLAPNSGQVFINNINLQHNPKKAKKSIGYLPETTALYSQMPVIDYLFFMGSMRQLKPADITTRLKNLVIQCGISSVLNKKIETLSKGFKQRVGLAQALIHDPQILILDEPTIGLDPNQISEIRELIKQFGKTKTILLSSHILQEIEQICDKIIVLNSGSIIAQGTAEELKACGHQQNKYFLSLRGTLSDIKQKITQLHHCTSFNVIFSEENKHKFEICFSDNTDYSELFFEMAVKNKWQLSQLIKNTATLETLFKDLTK